MRYSPKDTTEIMDWTSAAKRGGLASGVSVPGKPRSYAVTAWLEVPGSGNIDVTNIPLSSLDETASRAWRKELDLPITKPLVYKRAGKTYEVKDVAIVGVWDGWCTLLVAIKGGYEIKVHSMHFAEMNKASSISSLTTRGSEVIVESKSTPQSDKYPLTFTVFDPETTSNNPKDADICEMAAVHYDNGVEENRISILVHIDGEMPWEAERVHHIETVDAGWFDGPISAFGAQPWYPHHLEIDRVVVLDDWRPASWSIHGQVTSPTPWASLCTSPLPMTAKSFRPMLPHVP